ncbi:MAG: ABC transporter ATP-binding protein [Caldilineaceae bacterium]
MNTGTAIQTAIQTESLGKRYGSVAAVDGVSLRVGRGEIYAFLGLNGAGKTTTIRMLLGMVRPTAGEAWVLGQAVGGREGRWGRTGGGEKPWQSVGYLVETPHAYPELTVRENLEAVRRLRPGTPAAAVGAIIERLGLATYAGRRAGTLSLGNVQRLGLAKAMLHNPELLILDEPANGLDPAGIVEIRHFLRELAEERGVTIFLSSHLLGEVARVAQRIGIIHRGRLIEEMDVAELQRNRRRRLLVRTRDMQASMALLSGAGYHVRPDDDLLEITDADAIERPDAVAVKLVQGGHPPTMLAVEQEELEQYFLRLVGMEAGAA